VEHVRITRGVDSVCNLLEIKRERLAALIRVVKPVLDLWNGVCVCVRTVLPTQRYETSKTYHKSETAADKTRGPGFATRRDETRHTLVRFDICYRPDCLYERGSYG